MSNPRRSKDRPPLAERFAKAMRAVSEELGCRPREVTRLQLERARLDVSDYELRCSGGFAYLRDVCFPERPEELKTKLAGSIEAARVRKLGKELGKSLAFESGLVDAVRAQLEAHPLLVHAPVTRVKPTRPATRTLVAQLSDTHFGANVSLGETHGANEFTWTIAARRLARFCEQVALYKPEYRAETDLVLQVNGDIIAGLIHNQEWFVDLLAVQFSGALHLLVQAVSYLSRHFAKVTVHCQSGNHGRSMAKADKGRATTHKWDSYESMVYLALRLVLAEKHKNVEVNVPEAPFSLYQVQGHWVLQTHGDTVVNVGSPGKAIDMARVAQQVQRFHALLPSGAKLAVVSVGHVHVPTVQLLEGGCAAVINGCLSGVDPFAQSVGVAAGSGACQTLFEATRAHALGDVRLVHLDSADKDAGLDAIVKAQDWRDPLSPPTTARARVDRRRSKRKSKA